LPISHGSSRRSRGFTFAEVLAAMVLVAIVIPAVVRGMTLANRAAVMAERKRLAAELADSFLTQMVVTGEWRTSDRTGDFGDDWPGYRWEMSDAAWDVDTMRVVAVSVFFEVQGRPYSVQLSTLAEETEE